MFYQIIGSNNLLLYTPVYKKINPQISFEIRGFICIIYLENSHIATISVFNSSYDHFFSVLV